MRIVEIRLKCGWRGCGVSSSEADGDVVTKTIALDGQPPVEYEICKPHIDDLMFMLEPLMKDGRPAELKKAPSSKTSKTKPKNSKYPDLTDEDLTCKYPNLGEDPCGQKCKNAAGLAQHVTRTHGLGNLEEYFDEFPPAAERSTG